METGDRNSQIAWVSKESKRAAAQPGRRFPVLTEFVVELRSPSDRLKKVREKMDEWMESGALLGWLIDPETRSVTVCRPGMAPETVLNAERIAGEGPVAGFVLELTPV
jgi:Uma2 family endonuclease